MVIAILGILMTLLMPSIHKVRGKAKTAVCLSNMRSMGVINLSFSNDNAAYFVSGDWIDELKPYGDLSPILFCPQATTLSEGLNWGSEVAAWDHKGKMSSYGFNMWAFDWRDDAGVPAVGRKDNQYFYQIMRVETPSETALIFDSIWVDARPSSNDNESKFYSMDGSNTDHLGRIFINRHHSKKVNYLKVDGSAEVVPLTHLYQMDWNRDWNRRALTVP
ncbi:MAG: hypothetical protein HRT88_19945 [Lentisphaeraceae bacterium]|nr:hypothetical protein [Lentisphaeraceae bacterium]